MLNLKKFHSQLHTPSWVDGTEKAKQGAEFVWNTSLAKSAIFKVYSMSWQSPIARMVAESTDFHIWKTKSSSNLPTKKDLRVQRITTWIINSVSDRFTKSWLSSSKVANQFCSFGLFNTALNSVQVRMPERFGSWVGVVLSRYPKRVLMMLRMIERFGRLEVEKHYPKYYKKDTWIPSPYWVKVLMSQNQLASVKCLVCKALEKTNSTEFYRICWDWRGRKPKSSAIVISWSQARAPEPSPDLSKRLKKASNFLV